MENGQIVYKLVPAGNDGLWQFVSAPLNQLLAAMGLLIVSIYLYRTKKPIWYALLPMAFMLVLTIYAMLFKLRDFWLETPRNYAVDSYLDYIDNHLSLDSRER